MNLDLYYEQKPAILNKYFATNLLEVEHLFPDYNEQFKKAT